MTNFIGRLQSFLPPVSINDVTELKWYFFDVFKRSLLEIFPVEIEKNLEKSIRNAFKKLTWKRKQIGTITIDEFEILMAEFIFNFLDIDNDVLQQRFIISVKRKMTTRQAICDQFAQKFIGLVLPNMINLVRSEPLALSIIYEALIYAEKLYSIKEPENSYFLSASIGVVDVAYRYKFF